MKGGLKRGCTISLGRLQYIRWVTAGPTQKTKTNCEYIDKAVADSRQGLALYVGVGRDKNNVFRTILKCLELILCYDVTSGKGGMRCGSQNVRRLYRPGSLNDSGHGVSEV
jgi:hypothetical protein